MTQAAAQRNRLRLHLLYLNGKPAAHVIGIRHRDAFYALKTSYDLGFRHLSPGLVMLDHALRSACEEGCTSFELLGMESRWKHELANAMRTYESVCFFPPGHLGCRWCNLRETHRKPFAKQQLIAPGKCKASSRRCGSNCSLCPRPCAHVAG
ncbi:MAG: GNAT family N-acetyltransferase [Myxococcota bacterium]